ncbi:MAG: ATP-binding protein [Myxococcota bacterium]
MATAKQIAALVRSFNDQDDAQFFRVVLQVAAAEARKGHAEVARELRDLVDDARRRRTAIGRVPGAVPFGQPKGDLAELLRCTYPEVRLQDLVLAEPLRVSLDRLLNEHRRAHDLREHGLRPRRKLLLVGPPGTGKTMTANAIASELRLPLLAVRLDTLITRFLGETAAKLRLVFNAMIETRGVYLFDEFDALGAQRATPNDVGEIRRVLNSFLQFIEEDDSDSLIVAATNHVELLDRALFRRFDSVLRYERPDEGLTLEMLRVSLANFPTGSVDFAQAASEAAGIAQADILGACEEAAKDMILEGRLELDTAHLVAAIRMKRSGYETTSQP